MFDLIGHRGARALFPENTLAGVRAAIAMGLRSIEIDVGVTRDGAVVVHHDPALNPDTTRDGGGQWLAGAGPLLRELGLTELATYDVGRIRPGTSYAASFPQQSAVDGTHIPTLDTVLAIDDTTAWIIELKVDPTHPDWTVPVEEMAERVLHVAGAAGALDRVTIQSFDWRGPRHVRRIRPTVARGWLTDRRLLEDSILWTGLVIPDLPGIPHAIAAEAGGMWTVQHRDLTQDLLAQAHDLGLRVVPWTVNDPADLSRLMGWGVDGIITDWPDRAMEIVSPP